ncbi:protein tyrosine serine phosphatase [Moniliophthora roreri]|nr:protein tyrosine serine phosphatase [Moniliophthora roreri]
MEDLEPLDPAYVQDILSRPPFVTVEGVINVRDLGGYRSTSFVNKTTKRRLLYRSAELASVTEKGKKQLKELGISKVFDLRSDTEIEKYNSPLPSIDGVEIVRTPVFKKEDYSPEMMAKRYQLYASGKTEAFMELYSQILDHGGLPFGQILRHVRDRPNEGCLFHCTAGKDRTGLIAAIILKLAGVDNQQIAEDYALSRVGREPARAKIMQRLSIEPLFASNNEAALNMSETMTAFLYLLEDKYGGVENYCKQYLGLIDDDITTIRNNILTQTSPSHI